MNQCLSPAIVIPPGGTYSDTLRMIVGSQDDFFNEIGTTDSIVEYRLIWYQAVGSFDMNSYPFGKEVPREQRVSNAFTLTR